MLHPSTLEAAQQALTEGNTSLAFQLLTEALEKDGSAPELLRHLRLLEANFNTVKRKENNNLITFAEARGEYARTNDALLGLLDDLAAGKTTPPGLSGTGDGRIPFPWQRWLLGLGILLAGALLVFYFLRQPVQTTPNTTPQITEKTQEKAFPCPSFKSDRFKVMILQFQNVGEGKRTPELSIQSRIRELTANNQLQTDVAIVNDKSLETSTPDQEDAGTIGRQCSADMVIWGQFEPLSENAITVDIQYLFTNSKWPPGAASETFKNVSEIKSDRMKIENLDDAIFRICVALAAHENRVDLMEKWLKKITQPNPREREWLKQMGKGG